LVDEISFFTVDFAQVVFLSQLKADGLFVAEPRHLVGQFVSVNLASGDGLGSLRLRRTHDTLFMVNLDPTSEHSVFGANVQMTR